VPCEEFDDKALDPWRSAGSSALHHNVTHLAYLVPSTIENWQAPDA
jgi:hypothetical protein